MTEAEQGVRITEARIIMKQHIFLPILFIFVFVGCAVPGKSTLLYQPPVKAKHNNEVFINRPFSEVWDELVKELAKSFYVINNIDKTSRIINISFSTDTPEEYVDCGITTRTYKKGKEDEIYKYKVAESTSYKFAGKTGAYGQFPIISIMNRKSTLEGRINIYVAPENNGTRITVNCTYILNVSTTGSYITQNVVGQTIASGLIPSSNSSVALNTNQGGRANWGTAKERKYVTCHSAGKLEQDILSLIKP